MFAFLLDERPGLERPGLYNFFLLELYYFQRFGTFFSRPCRARVLIFSFFFYLGEKKNRKEESVRNLDNNRRDI